MDFISKKLNRMGKNDEQLNVTFRPVLYRFDVKTACEIYVVWKRGVDLKSTKKYKVDANNKDGFAV